MGGAGGRKRGDTPALAGGRAGVEGGGEWREGTLSWPGYPPSSPPSPPVGRHTPVKTLTSPILRMRAVNIFTFQRSLKLISFIVVKSIFDKFLILSKLVSFYWEWLIVQKSSSVSFFKSSQLHTLFLCDSQTVISEVLQVTSSTNYI